MNILKNILENKTLIRYIGIFILVALFLRQCTQISSLKQDLVNTEKISDRNFNNYKTAQDSVRVEIDKRGNLISTIGAYEYEITSLKGENGELLNKYKKVLGENNKLKNVNALISTDLTIKDSIINSTVNITQENDTFTFTFNDEKEWDKYNWRTFNGELKLSRLDSTYNIKSSRFDFNQGISLTTAIIEEDGRSSLRITTPYPGLNFTSIENINIVNDKLNQKGIKKSGWSIGVGFSYGLNLNDNQVISTGPSIGLGVYWSPKWLKF